MSEKQKKPKKLVRSGIVDFVEPDEIELITDKDELNALYSLKVKEELQEIINSNFQDEFEFADLLEVVFRFAEVNGISQHSLMITAIEKGQQKGTFNGTVLNNLNPKNPSNALYFNQIK